MPVVIGTVTSEWIVTCWNLWWRKSQALVYLKIKCFFVNIHVIFVVIYLLIDFWLQNKSRDYCRKTGHSRLSVSSILESNESMTLQKIIKMLSPVLDTPARTTKKQQNHQKNQCQSFQKKVLLFLKNYTPKEYC